MVENNSDVRVSIISKPLADQKFTKRLLKLVKKGKKKYYIFLKIH